MPTPVSRLAQELNVDVRTIRRDIRQLVNDGVEVVVERGRAGGAFLDDPKRKQPVDRGLPFVGRTRELTNAISFLKTDKPNALSILLVSGDAGIGKTRFLTELQSGLEDVARIAWGRCSETSQTAGLAPWDQVLRSLGATGLLDENSGTQMSDPLAYEGRILRRIVNLLRLFAETPAVLFIDDFHRADSATFRVLQHLLGYGRDLPVKIVLSYRGEEEEHSSVVQAMERDLAGDAAVVQISLSPLNEDDVRSVISRTGRKISDEIVAEMYHQSAGVPLFVEELVSKLNVDPSVRTRTLSQLINEKMNRLSHLTGRFLNLASAYGREFSPSAVGGILEISHKQTSDALSEGSDLGIIETDPHSPGTWRFRHQLVHLGVYEQIRDLEKETLHALWARHLIDTNANAVAKVLEHLEKSLSLSKTKQIREYRLLAGEECVERLAWREGRSLFQSFLEEVLGDELNPLQLARAHAGLGKCAHGLDLEEQAIEQFSMAFDLYCSAGREMEAISLALIPVHGPIAEQVSDLTEKALSISEPDSLEKGQLLSRRFFGRRGEVPISDLDEANRIARIHGDGQLETWNEGRRAQFLIQSLNIADGERVALRAARLSSTIADSEAAMHCYHWLAAAQFRSGELSKAISNDQRSLEFAFQSGNRSRMNLANRGLLRDELISGEFDGARQRLQWLLEHHVILSWDPIAAVLQTWSGESGNAIDRIDKVMTAALVGDREQVLNSAASCAVWMMDSGVETGTYSVASSWLRHQVRPVNRFMLAHYANIVAARGLLASQQADAELAKSTLHELESLPIVFGGDASLPLGFVPPFSMERIRARLLSATGEPEMALEGYERALEVTRSSGAIAEYLLSLIDYAEAILNSTRQRGLEELLVDVEVGIKLADGISMGMARDVLQKLSVQIKDAIRSGFGFTRQEHRIAEQLIEGKRNSEIAGTLFISERTVAGHVTKILAKTQSRTRAEAASKILNARLIGRSNR